jgi:hypothetical protein
MGPGPRGPPMGPPGSMGGPPPGTPRGPGGYQQPRGAPPSGNYQQPMGKFYNYTCLFSLLNFTFV